MRAFGLRDGVRRTGVVRGRGGPALNPAAVRDGTSVADDTRLFLRRRDVLPVLRPDSPDRVRADGIEHQFRDGGVRGACRIMDDGVTRRRREALTWNII